MSLKMNIMKSSVISVMLLNVLLSSSCASANNRSENDTSAVAPVVTQNSYQEGQIEKKPLEHSQVVSTQKMVIENPTQERVRPVSSPSDPQIENTIIIESPLLAPPVGSQSKVELMAVLANINYFSAKFTQKIYDESGEELQQGSGQLSVSKPNLVNWETKSPSESHIVSDGENLWFYDPFVEQVSVYSLENAIANTPILLITNNDPNLWQDYNVSKLTDTRYLIEGVNENTRVKSLELTFNGSKENIKLAGFSIIDATGQLSVIYLSEQINSTSDNNETYADLFTFTVPEGAYLDDQR